MKNILTLNISKAYNLIFSLFLSAAVAIGAQAKAAEGHFEETASYKSWSVGYFEKNNKTFARLITINNGAAFALDFENTTYYATATVLKAEGGRCRNNNSQKEMVNCFLRIDTKDMYSTTCDIEENTNFFLITINSGLNEKFLKEAMAGRTLRLKLDFPSPVYFSFSLSGFTKGYAKVSQLNNAKGW